MYITCFHSGLYTILKLCRGHFLQICSTCSIDCVESLMKACVIWKVSWERNACYCHEWGKQIKTGVSTFEETPIFHAERKHVVWKCTASVVNKRNLLGLALIVCNHTTVGASNQRCWVTFVWVKYWDFLLKAVIFWTKELSY